MLQDERIEYYGEEHETASAVMIAIAMVFFALQRYL